MTTFLSRHSAVNNRTVALIFFCSLFVLTSCKETEFELSSEILNPTPSPSPSPSPTPEVQYFGRFDFSTPSTPRFNWSGSSIRARFKGTEVKVDLAAKTNGGANSRQFFVAVIDNQAPYRFEVTGRQVITLADNLSDGEHTVLVMRDTEGREGGLSWFHGFDFGTGGELLAPTAYAHKLRLEVIGDSITCGFGNLGANSTCPFSIDTESAYSAYSQVAARSLGAQPATQLCMSGRGIVRMYGDNPTPPATSKMTLPKAFADTLSPGGDDNSLGVKWTFPTDSKKQPNVVLVNLGTNDFYNSTEPSHYRSTYVEFAQEIRTRYPNAHIILAIGTMNYHPVTAIQDVISQRQAAGDTKISYLQFAAQNPSTPNGVGCQYHPGYATHAIMAQALVNVINGLTLAD